MATYGPLTSTNFASDSGPLGGTIAWDADGTLNEATFAHGMQSTEALIYTDFGFDIPTDHNIVGVLLTFETKSKISGSSEVYDDTVKLRVSGSLTGTNKAGGYFYSVSSFGGSSDVWGATLTPALVNSSGFGFAMSASLESGSTTVIRVENPSLTIYTDGEDAPDGPGGGSAGGGNHTFHVFRDLAIPKNATINKAFLRLTAGDDNAGMWAGNENDTAQAIIRGQYEDTAEVPEDGDSATAMSVTASQIRWDEIEHFVDDETYDTPDIACVIQEIIDRNGWESGNDILILISDNGSEGSDLAITRSSYDYGSSPSKSAQLFVYYTLDEFGSGGARVSGGLNVNQARFNPTISGGCRLGGAADVPPLVIQMRGGCVVSGYAPIYGTQTVSITAAGLLAGGSAFHQSGTFGSGGAVACPVAETSMVFFEEGSGGVLAGGDLANIYDEIGTGGVICGGEAPAGKFYEFTGFGGVIVSGAPWLYKRTLIVPHSNLAATLDKFVLPVAIQLDPLKSAAGLFEFRDSNDNRLAAEIREFDSETGRLWAYVKTPLSSTSDTTLTLYYGK